MRRKKSANLYGKCMENPTSTIIILNFDSNYEHWTCCSSHNQCSNFVFRNNNICVAELDGKMDAQQPSTAAKIYRKCISFDGVVVAMSIYVFLHLFLFLKFSIVFCLLYVFAPELVGVWFKKKHDKFILRSSSFIRATTI